MTILIGTDEAGYGPNLGPLVVAATMWKVDETSESVDLYQRLSQTIKSSRNPKDSRLVVADSKVLYQSKGSLASLERGVLAAMASLGEEPQSWQQWVRAIDPTAANQLSTIPWYANYDLHLPVDLESVELEEASKLFSIGLKKAKVQLLAMRAVILFPGPFNRLVEKYDSKGEVLSQETLELIRGLLDEKELISGEPSISISCDKHGGRSYYAPLLQSVFEVPLVHVDVESRPVSKYRFKSQEKQVEIAFRARGESHLPSALASMVAKLTRELAMRAFNSFWEKEVPGIRPTAGYPGDAPRFKQEIAHRQRELGIEDHVLWRCR